MLRQQTDFLLQYAKLELRSKQVYHGSRSHACCQGTSSDAMLLLKTDSWCWCNLAELHKFLIKSWRLWKGCPEHDDAWEPAANLKRSAVW
jgi:hypothetical protein